MLDYKYRQYDVKRARAERQLFRSRTDEMIAAMLPKRWVQVHADVTHMFNDGLDRRACTSVAATKLQDPAAGRNSAAHFELCIMTAGLPARIEAFDPFTMIVKALIVLVHPSTDFKQGGHVFRFDRVKITVGPQVVTPS